MKKIINDTVIYTLNFDNDFDVKKALQDTSVSIVKNLKKEFDPTYKIAYVSLISNHNKWSHKIRIRKGNKIGVKINIKWEKELPTIAQIDVESSSMLNDIIVFTVTFSSILVGAFFGYNHLYMFNLSYSNVLDAVLVSLIFAIAGIIPILILKTLIMKSEKKENDQLINDIKNIILN